MAFAVTNDFTNGTTAQSAQVNTNFEDIENEFNSSSPTPDTLKHIVPLGTVIAWLKYFDKVDSGTTDSTTGSKLVDSTQNFVTTVSVGDLIHNTTDDTTALVTAIDSNTTLSIDSNIMVSGEAYIIYAPLTLQAGWVECNGQTLSDANSTFNGYVIPDLNASSGTARFLRGSQTSGTIGGTETHTHTTPSGAEDDGGVCFSRFAASSTATGATSTLPSYYEVVFILRVK